MIALLWAFCHRAGGGLVSFKGSGFIFRSLFPALFISEFFHLPWWYYISLIPAFYLGEFIKYSKHWHMGRGEFTFWQDFRYMTLRGLWFTFLPGLLVGLHDWKQGIILGLSGLSMGVAYELGHRCPKLGQEFNTGPEVAEFIFALMMGAIVWIMA